MQPGINRSESGIVSAMWECKRARLAGSLHLACCCCFGTTTKLLQRASEKTALLNKWMVFLPCSSLPMFQLPAAACTHISAANQIDQS